MSTSRKSLFVARLGQVRADHSGRVIKVINITPDDQIEWQNAYEIGVFPRSGTLHRVAFEETFDLVLHNPEDPN